MRPFAVVCIASALLSGCEKAVEDTVSFGARGRYAGVGLFPAGRMWTQMVRANTPTDPAVSKLEDDVNIIVVVDSKTGELRQCGNMSGYCVGMNPWSTPLAATQMAPIPVLKHAKQLDEEEEAASKAQMQIEMKAKPR